MINNKLKTDRFLNKKKPYCALLLLLVAVTLIFIELYHKFIFADYWYAYLDTARDTVDQYIPREIYEIRNYWNGVTNQYSLQFGLGANYVFPWYKYFNPVNLPLIILGQQNLRVALIISLYIKYIFTGLFSWLFFRRLIKDDRIGAICAILWTYSGYNVLWGQHYGFMTSMLAFTVFLCGLQLILDGSKRWYLAPLLFFPLASGAYAFFYQACIFSIIYGIIYVIINKDGAKAVLRKTALSILSVIVSIGLAAEYIVISAEGFLASSRTGNVVSASSNGIYPLKNLIAVFARFFSNDMLGVASNSYYPGNYYEIATIAVGALAVLAFFWLLQTKYKWRTLILATVSALCLCLPIVSHILLFKATTQRWTFIICLAEVIMIGFAVKSLLEALQETQNSEADTSQNKAKAETKSISVNIRESIIKMFAYSDFFLICSLILLFAFQSRFGYLVSKWSVVIVVCSHIMYHVAAIAIWLATGFANKKMNIRPAAIVLSIIFISCIIEMIAMNYRCVNSRKIVSAAEWENSIYNDGTIEVVEEIQASDNGLYRINKTYDSKYYNDAMVQNYYGMGSYYSLNSQNLIDTYAALGNYVYENTDTLTGTNYIRFPGDDIVGNTIMAVKYVVSNGDVMLPPEYYEKVLEKNGKTLYRNKIWNGFGKVYTEVISGDKFSDLEDHEKRIAISNAAVIYDMDETFELIGASADEGSGEVISASAAAGISNEGSSTADADGTANYVYDNEVIPTALAKLNANGSVTLAEDINRFYGRIDNASGQTGIVSIPLIYEKNWTAAIDGSDAKIYKINGGLLGIVVEPGEHSLELIYRNHTAIIGRIIGVIFAIGYVVMLMRCIKSK